MSSQELDLSAVNYKYVLVYSSGRCGTQHLAESFMSSPEGPSTYITHEKQYVSMRTKSIVDQAYRKFVRSPPETQFNVLGR